MNIRYFSKDPSKRLITMRSKKLLESGVKYKDLPKVLSEDLSEEGYRISPKQISDKLKNSSIDKLALMGIAGATMLAAGAGVNAEFKAKSVNKARSRLDNAKNELVHAENKYKLNKKNVNNVEILRRANEVNTNKHIDNLKNSTNIYDKSEALGNTLKSKIRGYGLGLKKIKARSDLLDAELGKMNREADVNRATEALNTAESKFSNSKKAAIGLGALAGTAALAYGGYKLRKYLKKRKENQLKRENELHTIF